MMLLKIVTSLLAATATVASFVFFYYAVRASQEMSNACKPRSVPWDWMWSTQLPPQAKIARRKIYTLSGSWFGLTFSLALLSGLIERVLR